jgi:hypothetical protein
MGQNTSEPAAAAVITLAVRPAASKVMLVVQRFGFALMMKSSQELRSRNFAQDCVQRHDGRQRCSAIAILDCNNRSA